MCALFRFLDAFPYITLIPGIKLKSRMFFSAWIFFLSFSISFAVAALRPGARFGRVSPAERRSPQSYIKSCLLFSRAISSCGLNASRFDRQAADRTSLSSAGVFRAPRSASFSAFSDYFDSFLISSAHSRAATLNFARTYCFRNEFLSDYMFYALAARRQQSNSVSLWNFISSTRSELESIGAGGSRGECEASAGKLMAVLSPAMNKLLQILMALAGARRGRALRASALSGSLATSLLRDSAVLGAITGRISEAI